MSSPTRQPAARRWIAIAAASSLAITLIACGSKANNTAGPTNTDSAAAQTGSAPSGSATGTGTPTTATTTSNGGGVGGQTSTNPYPTNAKDYGLAVLQAIANGNDSKIVDLSSLSTATYIQQQNYKGNYTSSRLPWVNTDCASSMCNYYDQHGDLASVGIDSSKLGKAGAATSVYIEGSAFAGDTAGYVQTFVTGGWVGGRNVIMLAYANQTIANFVKSKTTPQGGFVTQPTNCGTNRQCVDAGEYLAGGQPAGQIIHFTVDTTKLGKPNAIISATA